MKQQKSEETSRPGANPELSPGAESEVLTVRDASAFLHCHTSTVYRLVQHREIPGFHWAAIGGFYAPNSKSGLPPAARSGLKPRPPLGALQRKRSGTAGGPSENEGAAFGRVSGARWGLMAVRYPSAAPRAA